MKKYLIAASIVVAVLIAVLTSSAPSQVIVGNFGLQYVSSAPSGACSLNALVQELITTGTLYTCQSGTWASVGGAGSSAFSSLTGGTNTSAAMVVGTGASLGVSGSGTITATGLTGSPAITVSSCTGCGGGGLFSGILGTLPTQSGTGLTTAWNQQGSFSATNNPIGVTIADTAGTGGSDLNEGIVKTYPGVAYTLTALFSIPIAPVTNNYGPFGVVILNTLTTQFETCGLIIRSTPTLALVKWNSPTSYNSESNSTFWPAGFSVLPYLWIRVKDNGTTVTCSASTDGEIFGNAITETKSSGFLGSSGYNYLGIGVDEFEGPTGVSLMSWTISTP